MMKFINMTFKTIVINKKEENIKIRKIETRVLSLVEKIHT